MNLVFLRRELVRFWVGLEVGWGLGDGDWGMGIPFVGNDSVRSQLENVESAIADEAKIGG